MYTFRFNPVFNQWVLLGGPVPVEVSLAKAHFLDVGKRDGFVAATYPKQPFLLEPPAHKHPEDHLLHKSQAPVGEYELLLLEGDERPAEWSAARWEGWIMLAQQRLLQVHHNPYVHYVALTFHTGGIDTTQGYVRVGDLIATSHPVAGTPVELTQELAEKIRHRESMYIVEDTAHGALYVPSAPLHSRELWYLPTTMRSGFEQITPSERSDLARVLSVLFPALDAEFPELDFILEVHTNIAGMAEDATWWLQFYQADPTTSLSLQTRPLPEAFAQHLHFLLGHASGD